MNNGVKKTVTMAILAALSIVLMLLIRFPILPAAPYLIYEPADIPVLIGTFMFGPFAGILITVVVSAIQATLLSADGWVGFVMHVVATGAYAATAGLVYMKFHNKKGAIAALAAGTLARTAIMVPLNLIIQPNFYGVPYEAVAKLIVPAIIPFNLIKGVINSILTMFIYKTVSKVVKKL